MKSRRTLSSSLVMFMTSMVPTQIHQRSVLTQQCSEDYPRMTWNTAGTLHTKSHLTSSSHWYVRTLHRYRYFNMKIPVTIQVDTSNKGLVTTLIQDDGPVTLHPKCSNPQRSVTQTMKGTYLPVSSVQSISRHMLLVDTSQLRVSTNH